MPQPRHTRPLLPLLLAALARVIFGAALGLAPYAFKAMMCPELMLWDISDNLTLAGIVLQAVAGVFVLDDVLVPLVLRPMWREFDRAIVTPHMKATEAARNGMQWAEWSRWRQ